MYSGHTRSIAIEAPWPAIGVGRTGSILGPLLAGPMLRGGADVASVILWMVPFAVLAAVAVFVLSFHRAGSVNQPAA